MKYLKSQTFLLTILFLAAAILRFYKLGSIPMGISLNEAQIGVKLAYYLGSWVLEPFFIRLPFALMGIASVFLFYVLLHRLTHDFLLSYLSACFLAISPWHVAESRVFSAGILLSFLSLSLALIFLKRIYSMRTPLTIALIGLSATVFLLSILKTMPILSETVNRERFFTNKFLSPDLATLFSNKLVAGYRHILARAYEHLDFGVYFFSGHPRQRWGIEETHKFFVAFTPLLLVGILQSKIKVLSFLIALSLFLISAFVFFDLRGPSETLPLIFILIYFIGLGANNLLTNKKLLPILLVSLLFLFYELLNFNSHYFSGYTESMFSPRRPAFEKVINGVELFRKPGEKVLVTERLGSPKTFFQFHLKDTTLKDIEFRNFEVWQENTSYLFVDVLPFEPSPAESLYHENTNFPEKLHLLLSLKDDQLRQNIFIYRYAKAQ